MCSQYTPKLKMIYRTQNNPWYQKQILLIKNRRQDNEYNEQSNSFLLNDAQSKVNLQQKDALWGEFVTARRVGWRDFQMISR